MINCYSTIYVLIHMRESSTPFLPISLTKAIENTSLFSQSFALGKFDRKMSWKIIHIFLNNHTAFLVYRILIISI